MAEIVGCLAMSHAPQLMLEPDRWSLLNTRSWDPLPERPELANQTLETKRQKWNLCQAAIEQLRAKLAEFSADTVVVVGDDQHENLLDDNMPPFAVFFGEQAEASVSMRYLQQPLSENRTSYRVDAGLGRWLVVELMEAEFDPAYCLETRYEGGLGHAFARPLRFLMADARSAILPVMVNTYHPPAPSPRRCVQFGRALSAIIQRYPEHQRVVLLASGGLSHTRIDEALDHRVIQALESADLPYLAAMSSSDLVEGTSEIRNWIVVAAAANRPAQMVEYQPLYRTSNGVGCAMGFAYWE